MRLFFWVMLCVLLGASCTKRYADPYPDLVETEKELVSNCKMIGVIAEMANAGNPFGFDAKQRMILRVRQRAGTLGATHIVWLHKTDTSSAAEAYQCPPP